MGLINNLLTDISLYSSCFQKNENIALLHFKRKRKNRIHLNSHRCFVSLVKILLGKIKMHRYHAYCSFLRLVTQRPLSPFGEREELRDETK